MTTVTPSQNQKAWGGRFASATDRLVEQFTQSVTFDQRLAPFDIEGSIAHAKMLGSVGIITVDEAKQIVAELQNIGREIATGTFKFVIEREDVHMNIEATLIERLGDVGRKLHSARSRNDQVITAFRLWTRDAIDTVVARIRALQSAFVGMAEREQDTIIPAYTHLQRAQPVVAAHHLLAYVEKLQRDLERFEDCRKRVNQSPLGSAAVAGTSLPIDREFVADELGFEAIMANSMDATSARDFAAEAAFCLAMIATHLSNWAEDWILWSTTEFGFLTLPDSMCTGSSIMPQKKNPDVLELIRGKTARAHSCVTHMLVLQKGLPLAYNRDLQEDKEALFAAFDSVIACLEVAAPLVAQAKLNPSRINARLEEGFSDATTFMEYLIAKGVPMREAHEIVGKAVGIAESKNVTLSGLTLAELQELSSLVAADVSQVLGARNALKAFSSYGSTQPDKVRAQIKNWQEQL